MRKTEKKIRHKKNEDRSPATPKRFDPRYEDVTGSLHSPRPEQAKTPAWFYSEKEVAKANKIEDWHTRKLNYTVAELCKMLGVKPSFVVEVYEFYGLEPFPAAGTAEPEPAGRRNAHTIWCNGGPRPVSVEPKSKGGPR